MKTIVTALALLAGACAQAQVLDSPQRFGASTAPPHTAADAAEAPMLAAPSMAGTLQEWYAKQNRPPLVVYFNKKLDQLPPGWRGSSRLLVEDKAKGETRRVTIGVEHNSQQQAALKSDFANVFEQSLAQEMKRGNFRLLDSTFLHRKQSASNSAEGSDIEYESLRKSARFVFEVQLVYIDGGFELLGGLKDIVSGDLAASVRMPVDGALDSPDLIDRASRALVKRLLHEKAG